MKGILFALCYILSALYYFVQSASEAKFMTKITSTVKKKKKRKMLVTNNKWRKKVNEVENGMFHASHSHPSEVNIFMPIFHTNVCYVLCVFN